jgi:chemotaxis protein methyltransferase CheR
MSAIAALDENDSELNLLLDAILHRYHFDFRHYVRPLLRRRVARAKSSLGTPTVAGLRDLVLDQPDAFAELLRYLTIRVSDLFRDPGYYRLLREMVMPRLRTYPSVKIWVAGCGTGEEAYSFAILLHEEGLLDNSIIYATDIEPESLRIAAEGSYALGRMRGFSESYFRSEVRSDEVSGTAFTVTLPRVTPSVAGPLPRR